MPTLFAMQQHVRRDAILASQSATHEEQHGLNVMDDIIL